MFTGIANNVDGLTKYLNNTPTFESVYGEIKFVRGMNTNTKVVTVRKSKFYVMNGCNLPAEALPSDKKEEKKDDKKK